MGQYYKAYVLPQKADGTFPEYNKGEVFKFDWAKLMEHSWVGNWEVNEVIRFLVHRPSMVAWMGDYAVPAEGRWAKLSKDDMMRCYKFVHGSQGERKAKHNYDLFSRQEPAENKEIADSLSDIYLVNDTQKRYISLKKYAEIHTAYYCPEGKKPEDHMIEHPLPLLTACGNGRGGGDFSKGIGFEHIGSWAFDTIHVEFKEDVPADYEDVTIALLFREILRNGN